MGTDGICVLEVNEMYYICLVAVAFIEEEEEEEERDLIKNTNFSKETYPQPHIPHRFLLAGVLVLSSCITSTNAEGGDRGSNPKAHCAWEPELL